MLPVRRANLASQLLDPFRELNIFDDLDRVYDRVFGGDSGFPAEIWEDDENLYVEIEMPGLKGEDVNVSYENSILRVEGEKKEPERKGEVRLSERRYGKFVRTFHLPNIIDADSIKASYKDGVLTITCAKKPETKPKKIQITTSD